jgi:SAM-dependent methyltransferase
MAVAAAAAYRRPVTSEHDVWAVGGAYEAYIGRWSRPVAVEFVRWLAGPASGRWVDVGCGTGALTATVLASADPAHILGVDPSSGFLAEARTRVTDPRASFQLGDAQSLPLPDRSVDAVVSGLALNFVPNQALAAGEIARILAPGGVAGAYVWDYTGMGMIRHFWDAAIAIDPAVAELDEGGRFPLCHRDALAQLWTGAGLGAVQVRAVEVPTVFADFDDYWGPFLGGQGPAPAYVATLSEGRRDALRDLLHERLPIAADGSIPLTARAWAVRGVA